MKNTIINSEKTDIENCVTIKKDDETFKLLSLKEASEILDLDSSTIRRWYSKGYYLEMFVKVYRRKLMVRENKLRFIFARFLERRDHLISIKDASRLMGRNYITVRRIMISSETGEVKEDFFPSTIYLKLGDRYFIDKERFSEWLNPSINRNS